jgi:hypothetical protein
VGLAFSLPGSALAQSGAPRPGWVQTPGGDWAPPGHPLETCDLRTLRGSYVFAATGYNIVGGVAVPKAIVEAIRFNGDGTLAVPAVTVSINGVISSPPPGGVGVYTLDAGCTGTVTFTPGPSFHLFVGPTGTEGWMIQTNPNTVFQGTITRVSR